jgi:uncharacterized protein
MSVDLSNLVHNEDLKGLVTALKGGADANALAYGGETALHYAAERGFTAGIAPLIEAGGDPNVVSERGDTPLIVGVIHKNPDAVEALLDGGANPEIPNKLEATPLAYACRMNAGKTVSMTRTVTVDGVEKEEPVDMSPREEAAKEVARVLIARGADVNAADSTGMTGLLHAAQAGDVQWASLFLEGGCNASCADQSGFTALHEAAASGNLDFIELLLAHSADKDAKIVEGWDVIKAGMTPRDVAETKGHTKIAERLSA